MKTKALIVRPKTQSPVKNRKQILVRWDVSDKSYAHLHKVAKSWGHRNIQDYIKTLVITHIGRMDVFP